VAVAADNLIAAEAAVEAVVAAVTIKDVAGLVVADDGVVAVAARDKAAPDCRFDACIMQADVVIACAAVDRVDAVAAIEIIKNSPSDN
jgi:hypothetical protein